MSLKNESASRARGIARPSFSARFVIAISVILNCVMLSNAHSVGIVKKDFSFLPDIFGKEDMRDCQVIYSEWLLAVNCRDKQSKFYLRDLINLDGNPNFEVYDQIDDNIVEVIPQSVIQASNETT